MELQGIVHRGAIQSLVRDKRAGLAISNRLKASSGRQIAVRGIVALEAAPAKVDRDHRVHSHSQPGGAQLVGMARLDGEGNAVNVALGVKAAPLRLADRDRLGQPVVTLPQVPRGLCHQKRVPLGGAILSAISDFYPHLLVTRRRHLHFDQRGEAAGNSISGTLAKEQLLLTRMAVIVAIDDAADGYFQDRVDPGGLGKGLDTIAPARLAQELDLIDIIDGTKAVALHLARKDPLWQEIVDLVDIVWRFGRNRCRPRW